VYGYNIHLYFAAISHGMKTLLSSQIVFSTFVFSKFANAISMFALVMPLKEREAKRLFSDSE